MIAKVPERYAPPPPPQPPYRGNGSEPHHVPLNVEMSRDLAARLGCVTIVDAPKLIDTSKIVMLVIPRDNKPPGMIWQLDTGAFNGATDNAI